MISLVWGMRKKEVSGMSLKRAFAVEATLPALLCFIGCIFKMREKESLGCEFGVFCLCFFFFFNIY